MLPPVTPFSSAADRNKQAILDVLRQVIPTTGAALEIASGTGQHIAYFATQLPQWTWQPSDTQADALPPMAAWLAHHKLPSIQPPLLLDVMDSAWPCAATAFDLVYCANMLHIAPWPATAALLQGSARQLAPLGCLVTYGPYLEDNVPTAPSNQAFDKSLRMRNPAWGIRQREAVEQEAAHAGLYLAERHTMPANNLLLVWRHG